MSLAQAIDRVLEDPERLASRRLAPWPDALQLGRRRQTAYRDGAPNTFDFERREPSPCADVSSHPLMRDIARIAPFFVRDRIKTIPGVAGLQRWAGVRTSGRRRTGNGHHVSGAHARG
jgi:hypothetical protein